jgi:uncharacterized protein (TIGR02145 family)
MKKLTIILSVLVLLTLNACKKTSESTPEIEYGSMTDVDGNSYKTVKIGTQWWMAEDLRVSKYRDGSWITLVAAPPIDTTWSHFTTGAYTNNNDNGGHIIGRFYNYYAVADSHNIAPQGWHIPTDDEWKQMEQYLGMSAGEANGTGWRGTHEGEKLKVKAGTVGGWSAYGNVWATNESGFSAMAGGCRMFEGGWGNPGQYATGFWWTISTNDNQAYYRYMDYKNANVFRYYGPKTYGFSVRCVKD